MKELEMYKRVYREVVKEEKSHSFMLERREIKAERMMR